MPHRKTVLAVLAALALLIAGVAVAAGTGTTQTFTYTVPGTTVAIPTKVYTQTVQVPTVTNTITQTVTNTVTQTVTAPGAPGWVVAPPQSPVHDLTNTNGVGLLVENAPSSTWTDYSTTTGTSDSSVLLGPECMGVTFDRFHIENAASVGSGPGYGRHALYDKAANTTVNDWYSRSVSTAPYIGSQFSLRYHGFAANRFDIGGLWDVSFFDDDPGNVPGSATFTDGRAAFTAVAATIVDSQFQWTITFNHVDFTGPNDNVMTIDSGSVPPVVTFNQSTINGKPIVAADIVGATAPASLTINN